MDYVSSCVSDRINYLLSNNYSMDGYQLKKNRLALGLSQEELAGKTGISQPTIARYERTGVISKVDAHNTLDKFFKENDSKADFDEDNNPYPQAPKKRSNTLQEPRRNNWTVTKKSDATSEPNPRLEAEPLGLASDPNDYDNDGSKFEEIGGGIIRMRVKVVPQKAYAGYLRGFTDPEFFEDLQTVSIDVQKEHRGYYLSFEVKGDSMVPSDPDLLEHMAFPGWKAVSREVPRQHWRFKLHTHKTDAWIIVHRTEGILIKNIINHNVEEGIITIHSLNPKYPDEDLYLDEIAQIFSVVKYIVDK